MKIITIDGKEWNVKYQKNKESISFDVGTTSSNYPNFTGSKLNQNSSSSDKYSLTFSVNKTSIVSFKESFKKFVVDDSKAVVHPTYGKLTHIIIEYSDWGAIKGSIISSPTFATSSDVDILINCTFQEHTPDTPEIKRDFEAENTDADNSIDEETTDNFDVDLDAEDKSALEKFADLLAAIYKNIKNSAVVAAFNNLKSELNKVILNSKRIMNSVKSIISLPGQIISDISGKIELINEQAVAIKALPVNSFNMAKFNINCLSYNCSALAKTAYITDSSQSISGIKTVALS